MHSDISESVIQIPLPLCVNLARAKIQMISAENVRKGPERIGSTSLNPRLHSEKALGEERICVAPSQPRVGKKPEIREVIKI